MYDDLVKRLREWPRVCQQYEDSADQLHDQAADAIEELSADCDMYRKGMTDEHNRAAKLAWDKEHCWIPVTERLPESGQRVLVVGLHGEAMYIGTYTGGIKETAYRKAKPYKINAGGYGWRSFTWWMPLPQPPKE